LFGLIEILVSAFARGFRFPRLAEPRNLHNPRVTIARIDVTESNNGWNGANVMIFLLRKRASRSPSFTRISEFRACPLFSIPKLEIKRKLLNAHFAVERS